ATGAMSGSTGTSVVGGAGPRTGQTAGGTSLVDPRALRRRGPGRDAAGDAPARAVARGRCARALPRGATRRGYLSPPSPSTRLTCGDPAKAGESGGFHR